jgi:putative ABC transport system permease protein
VLGFYNGEVNAYIFRETVLLSLFGALVGLVGGFFLHRFVILTVEVSAIMFGRKIFAASYLYAACITMIFTVMVSVVLSRKLKKISMVESMKSVD